MMDRVLQFVFPELPNKFFAILHYQLTFHLPGTYLFQYIFINMCAA